MQALQLYTIGGFNSFRIPGNIQYQPTYLYPPKTTLIGLVGAALGLEDTELESLYRTIKVGIVMESLGGHAEDLWQITKLKDRKDEIAVVPRQILYKPCYWIYLSPSETYTLDKLQGAFRTPCYPLTLGRSDELVHVRSIRKIELQKANQRNCYKWTVLPFDYRKKLRKGECKLESGTLSEFVKLPQVFVIPTGFHYEERGGRRKRSPINRRPFTHVYDLGIILEETLGYRHGDRAFYLY